MKRLDNKVTFRLTQLCVAVAGIVLLLLLDRAYRADVVRTSDQELSAAASIMQRHLSVRLHHLTLVANDLRAFLLTQPGPPDSQTFADIAASLRTHYPALDALVYVGPDRVIRQIHPLAGNERAIGLDLSKRPYAAYIEKAIRERQLIVDPPHTMSNGRLSVIARSPIYRGETFIGLAQTVLHVPTIIEHELSDLRDKFTLQLRDENGKLFWGEESLGGAVQSREVVVGNGVWTLTVAAVKAPEISGVAIALIWGIGGLVLVFFMRSVSSDYRSRVALKVEVDETTHELRLRNEELESQIAKREAAEANVHWSEQRLREAQQIAHVGNWEWDIVNDRIHWSDEFFRIFGYKPQAFEPTFEIFHSRVHPDDRDALQKEVAEALKSGDSYAPEHRILLPDGTIRYVQSSGIFERDAAGNPLRVAGTLQDVTDQKLAIMALEASERKYRAVLENASDGIVIASLEGRVLDVNRRIQDLLGYSRNELLTMHVTQLHPPGEAEKLHAVFARLCEHGSTLVEHLVLRKDGTTTPVEVAGTFIAIGSEQVALGVFRDISERKRIDAELHQHRHHLEQLVEQRTAELVALNGELESFSYSVSHDLRSPLRAVKGFSMMLREDYGAQLDDTARDYLERITSATERMGRLIDDMLRLSGTIRGEMHWETISLSKLAAELMQELSAADPKRRVRFVADKEIIARGDATLLRCLLQNLLSNAWKYTRARSDAVIEFGVASRAGKPVYFVGDNGIGFEMIHARDLFEPFNRLHGPADYEGSGIGLATVQRIVHRHGGQTWAESEPGQGATFYFTLGSA